MHLLSSELLLGVVPGPHTGFSSGVEEAVTVHCPLGATHCQPRRNGTSVCLCWLKDVTGSAVSPHLLCKSPGVSEEMTSVVFSTYFSFKSTFKICSQNSAVLVC